MKKQETKRGKTSRVKDLPARPVSSEQATSVKGGRTAFPLGRRRRRGVQALGRVRREEVDHTP